jgi:hypothetical protein
MIKKHMRNKVYQADLMLLLTAAIWGSAFVAQRVGMNHVGPLTFNGIRFALGALVLVPLMGWRNNRNQGISKGSLLKLIYGGLIAGVVLFAGATLQQVGLVYTTAGKAGFITGLYVIFVPIFGLFFGLRLGYRWMGWRRPCCRRPIFSKRYRVFYFGAWRFLGSSGSRFLGCSRSYFESIIPKIGYNQVGMCSIYSLCVFKSKRCGSH